MEGKLDQSLDQIMKDRRSNNPRRGRGRRVGKVDAVVAPSGGISKSTKAAVKVAKANGKIVKPVVPVSGAKGDSKIVISGLPQDVNEKMIKEYTDAIAPPTKRVMLSYDANGRSRGVATVIFGKPGSALLASQKMHGIKVDGRVIKVEVIVEAAQAPIPVPAKTLADRMSGNKKAAKDKPKSAAATKGGDSKRGKGATGRGRNAARSKPKKSKEDLDAEMTDYFNDGTTAAANGAANGAVNGAGAPTGAAATASGDAGMEDEIM